MSLQVEVNEALCSAFYNMPFVEFLGEQDDVPVEDYEGRKDTARLAWFHVGERPKDMRVTVIRPTRKEEVRVRAEWRNYFADGRNPLKGEQTFTISTYAASQAELEPATEQVVLKVLELFQQVLSEDGVAGAISDLVEDTKAEDEEVEDTA